MASKVVRSGSVSVDPDQTFILGIDIGTTSVKVCIVDTATRAVVAIQSKDTQGKCYLNNFPVKSIIRSVLEENSAKVRKMHAY